MQQDFEATLNEFLAQAKVHFETQNETMEGYSRWINQAQEQLLDYQAFVNAVVDSLESIQEAKKAAKHSARERESVSESKTSIDSETIAAPVKFAALSPKLEAIDPKNVLIVDQTELNRVLMGRFFSSLPVTLEFANSGEQALGKIGTRTFDMILMSLKLKGMSGADAIKTIREAQVNANKKPKIIAIVADESSEDEKTAVLSAGADECFSKSMPRDEFREKVLNLLISASSPDA